MGAAVVARRSDEITRGAEAAGQVLVPQCTRCYSTHPPSLRYSVRNSSLPPAAVPLFPVPEALTMFPLPNLSTPPLHPPHPPRR